MNPAGSRDSKELFPIEPELVDRLANIFERAVGVGLSYLCDKLRTPTPGEFLDAGYVDDAVVQESGDFRHVLGEEAAVLPDRIAAQGRRASLGMPIQEIQCLRLGFGERYPVVSYAVDETGSGMVFGVPTSSMRASVASGCEMDSTGPSAITLSSLSVTMVAISRMTSTSASRPVISISIQTRCGGMLRCLMG